MSGEGRAAVTEGSGEIVEDRRGWRLVLVGTLVSSIGSGLTLPFLVVYLHSIRHMSLPLAGLVVAASGIAGLATGAIGGSLADRLGVGRLLFGGLLISGVATVALADVRTPVFAAVVVALIGVGESVIWPTLNALVASQLASPNRPRAYALRFGVLNGGLGLGALIAGSVVSLHRPVSFEVIYVVDGLTTIAFAVIVGIGLRHRPGFRTHPEVSDKRAMTGEGYRVVLRDRRFLAWLVASALFVFFGYAMLDGGWAAYATVIVHASPRIVGIGFAVNTGVIVVSQLGVAHLTRRWRRSRMLLGVGVLWSLGWLMAGLADIHGLVHLEVDVLLALSLGIFGLGETLLSPVAGALPNDLAPEHLRARYNALGSTVWSLGTIAGPPIAGLLLASSFPLSWIGLVVIGSAAAGFVGLNLGRLLPPAIDRPLAPDRDGQANN
ncbi:MFS transporter [Ferrimicrobium sp.]|uniref:MFS transporter n=1 Tax=Ferrimicrobium sp. TaxID=2926050 RepID=UPI00260BC6D0|nr:MFS transporter [Ferrimicrobium sp.]